MSTALLSESPVASARAAARVLPEWASSVADLSGELTILRIHSKYVPHLQRELIGANVGFYYPLSTVVKWYAGKRREWQRAFLPTYFFVADGERGRGEALGWGEYFTSAIFGVEDVMDKSQDALRRDLVTSEQLLLLDPQLETVSGLVKGQSCRVTAGLFQGYEGYVEDLGDGCRLNIVLKFFGRSTPVEINREDVEPI